jgi:hypothetical protein
MSTAIIPAARPEFIKMHKSLYLEEINRTGTRIPRINRNLSLRGIEHALHALLLMIGRIYTDPGARRLERAPEHGEAMIVCLSGLNNHREHRGHREKRQGSVLSVYSVVDQLHSNSFYQNKSKNNKPQMNADKRTINTFGHSYLNGAGVATPDPGEAPPLAGFNMKSLVAYNLNHRYLLGLKRKIDSIRYHLVWSFPYSTDQT